MIAGLLLAALLSSLPLLTADCPNGLSAEMLLSAQSLGITFSPGAALYLLITHLFIFIFSHDNLVHLLSLFSLVCSVLAALMIYLTARRLQFVPLVSLASTLIFFFSPLFWSSSIIPHHLGFNLLILTMTIYMTIRLLIHSSHRSFDIKAIAWAVACGLTTTQHVMFLPWGIGLFILGIGVGFPRHRARGSNYLIAFLVYLATIVLLLLYLPWRITTADLFFNSDYVYQYSSLSRHFFWSRLSAWFIWYITGGHHPVFMFHDYRAVLSLWPQIWSFLVTYPFLPLLMMGLGLLANLKSIFIKQHHPTSKNIDMTGRLMLALMPLMALGGSAMLLTELRLPFQVGLTLAATFWSLRALEYCYYQLGRSTEQLYKKIKQKKPTLFAITIIALVPLFAFLHSYRTLVHHQRAVASTATNLSQVAALANQLESDAALCFPTAADSFIFRYAQDQKKLPATMSMIPFSYHWPNNAYIGPSILYGIYDRANHAQQHRLNYMAYWVKQLRRMLAANRPVYLVLPAQPPDPALDYLLQAFALQPVAGPRSFWYTIDHSKQLYLYRLSQPALPAAVSYRRARWPVAGRFDERLTVSKLEQQLPPVIGPQRPPLIQFSLNWQFNQSIPDEQLFCEFQILPKQAKSQAITMLDHHKRPWVVLRRLASGRLLNRIKPGGHFQQEYQLAIPAELMPGRFQVALSIIVPKTKERLPVDNERDVDQYYLSLFEFEVVSEASSNSSP